MKEQNDCLYDFESFRIDTLKRQLLRDWEVLPLTSKAFKTLLMLVHHRGEIVTKDELMKTIWFDTVVEENNLIDCFYSFHTSGQPLMVGR